MFSIFSDGTVALFSLPSLRLLQLWSLQQMLEIRGNITTAQRQNVDVEDKDDRVMHATWWKKDMLTVSYLSGALVLLDVPSMLNRFGS